MEIAAASIHAPAAPTGVAAPDRLSALGGLARALAGDGDPASLLEKALRLIVDATGAVGAEAEIEIRTGSPVKAVAGFAGDLDAIDFQASLGLPLRVAGTTLGKVIVYGPSCGAAPTAEDLDFVASASFAAAAAAARAASGHALSEAAATTRELDLAATIQARILPTPDPARSPVQGLNRPIRKVSGDFYDYVPLSADRFAFALGDVSGKGINAALMMSRAASLFRCLAKTIDDPAGLLRILNREIRAAATHGMFVTMVAGVYDVRSGHARFANAGHEPPLLRRADRSYVSFEADSPPLGIMPDIDPTVEDVEVAGGELYMYSDGLTEFGYGDDEMLGVTGLIQMVEVSNQTPLSERLEAVLADLEDDGWAARDDLTVLTIDGNWIRRND